MTAASGCDYVSRYLQSFLDQGARSGFVLEAVTKHVETCTPCYDQLAHFFRAIELPESTYLRETIDEMCLAMYHLANSIIADRKEPETNTDNLVSVDRPRATLDDHATHGAEMIDDAEDYTGSADVAGCDLESVRGLLDRARSSRDRKVDLAATICDDILRIPNRHVAKASNLLGVLRLWQDRLTEAEAAFLRTLTASATDHDARTARAFAHCNLGYVSQMRGDLERAVKSARRSIAISEELGDDPFFGWFSLLYFCLLRKEPGEAAAREAIEKVLTLVAGPRRLADGLGLENNAPILAALRASPLAADYPQFVPPMPPPAAKTGT